VFTPINNRAKRIVGTRRHFLFACARSTSKETRFMAHHWPVILLVDSEPGIHQACTAEVRDTLPEAAVYMSQDHALDDASPDMAPDFIIVDYKVGVDPLLRIRQLHDRFPQTPILMLIPTDRDELTAPALAAGAADYLMKTQHVHLRLPLLIGSHLQRRAERQRLVVSQQRYRRLFDSAPIGLFRCSSAGEFLAVNPMVGAILGIAEVGDLIGRNLTDFFYDPDEARQWQSGKANASQPAAREVQMRRANGDIIWVRIRADAVVDDDADNATAADNDGDHSVGDNNSDDAYCEGFIEEISNQRQAEAALRASEEKLRMLLEHAFDGISIYEEVPETRSRRLIECNDQYVALSGFSREELMAIGNTSTVQQKVGRVFTHAENLLIRQRKTPYRGFFSWQRPDGKKNVIEYSAAPIDVAGRPLTIGVDRDITELVQIQETALRRAAHLEAINAVIAAGAAATTIPALLEQTTQQLVAALQANDAIMCVDDVTAIVGFVDEDTKGWMQTHCKDCSSTARLLSVSPSRQLLSAPIVHEDRRLGGFAVGAKQNTTWSEDVLVLADSIGRTVGATLERLQLLAAERERQRRSEEHGRLATVGQLAAGIAHDFNNILAVVLLLAQLTLQEKALSEKGRSRQQTIIEQTQRAAELVRQILDFSRKSVLTRTRGNLASLLDETATLLQRTLPENIQIVVEHGGDDFTAEADFPRLKQVLLNLAVNAQDAMPAGGVLALHLAGVHIAPTDKLPQPSLYPGNWFKLTMTDTGSGIPAHVLPHIFEPFLTTKEVGKGSGLGLAQVYGIVKQHDGEIVVESRELEGTKFTIYLPAPVTRQATVFALAAPPRDAQPRPTLLYVEDDVVLSTAIRDVLDSQGFRVLSAASGEDALAHYGDQLASIALVVADLSLRGMSGLDLHHALRQRHPTIRTLIVSGYPTPPDRSEWQAAGIVGWMQKPVNLVELVSQIRQALATGQE
jgi:two-component system cell cycle sensor histidine kinase/response regulator CckA